MCLTFKWRSIFLIFTCDPQVKLCIQSVCRTSAMRHFEVLYYDTMSLGSVSTSCDYLQCIFNAYSESNPTINTCPDMLCWHIIRVKLCKCMLLCNSFHVVAFLSLFCICYPNKTLDIEKLLHVFFNPFNTSNLNHDISQESLFKVIGDFVSCLYLIISLVHQIYYKYESSLHCSLME